MAEGLIRRPFYDIRKRDGNMNFYDRMRMVCLAIPKGRVATYGQIAALCGKPRNSRQVGYGLKMNLAGEDVPAHRIVNGKGELSGASYFKAPKTQKILLEEEDVEVQWDGKSWTVDLKRYGWRNSIEEALCFEQRFSRAKSSDIPAETVERKAEREVRKET